MFAVLHIADFALEAVLRTEAGASARPAALFADTSKKSVVLAANARARACGVDPGMTAPQAVARCPTLLVRAPHAGAETEARAMLLAAGFTLSPLIEDTAPGICTIDVKGVDRAKLEHAVRATLAELVHQGLPATAGIAATPLLALYAARAAHEARHTAGTSLRPVRRRLGEGGDVRGRLGEASLPLNAVAEERPRNDYGHEERATPNLSSSSPILHEAPEPAGQRKREEKDERERSLVLHITDAPAFLATLPLAAADPTPEFASILASWGLRTLGDLTALPRDEIVRRFGAEGLALWQRASGGSARPLHPVAPPQTFSAGMELEDEIETLEPLLFILRRFLDRLTLELRASQDVAAELHLTLRLGDETQHTRSFRLPEPTGDAEILFRALHTHLESLHTEASIGAVELRITPARPLVRQQGLFETGLRDPHGFAETLARIAALVGADRVGTPVLENTHRPDAVTLVAPANIIPAPAEPPLHAPLGLPLRRFRPPLRAQVEFTDGRPTYVWTDTLQGEITRISHEWPSQGEWWQADRAWARTEWDIAVAGGGLYRLLLVGESYFIEGEYD